ncbi:MAG: hypothetical protein CME63_11035 [Halobacteriovoraceae bacterium]|nr:hypothetical protein [Halobacteriovoraceae bacterium]|tara:strand:+ start:22217 stop:23131 length:915 start_codon:yes stop_codon:yes gene_type:complete
MLGKKKNSFLVASTVFVLVMGAVALLDNETSSEQIDSEHSIDHSLVANAHKEANTYRKKILEKALPKKATGSAAYRNFVDSAVTTDQYLEELRIGQAKEFLKTSFKSLKDCYREGCGQLPDEDDGFYDPALSIAQQSLKRLLEITARHPKKLDLRNWMEESELLDLLGAENQGLRQAAFENLVNLKGTKEAFQDILEKTRELQGEAAGDALKNMLTFVNEDNKQDLIDSMALISKEGSSATVLGILENLSELKVSQSQINQITEGLCRFKEKKSESHNVAAMSYYLKSMAANSGIELEAQNYCL